MKAKMGALLMMTLFINKVDAKSGSINEVLNDYFEGYQKADVKLIKKAFHQDTRLLSVDNNELDRTEMSDWLTSLEARAQNGDIRIGKMTVLSLDVTEYAALAKIRIQFTKFEFTDYLSLLKIKSEWKIVGKIYHYKPL